MLERETELIRQIIIESTINGRDSVKLGDIVGTPLPRGVKAFLTASVMGQLEADFKQSPKLSQIAEGLGAVAATERSLLHTLAMAYTLRREEYVRLVEDAVHFLENYLCRPQWTLHQMLFEGQETVPAEIVVKKLECIADYTYFRELLERQIRTKGVKSFSAEQFRTLLARIDEVVVKQHAPRELALLAKPIFDFLLFGNESMTRPIPLGAILLFFEDKKMIGVKEYVERICQVRARRQISMNELIGILEDLYNVETTVKEEVEKSEQEIFNPPPPNVQEGVESKDTAAKRDEIPVVTSEEAVEKQRSEPPPSEVVRTEETLSPAADVEMREAPIAAATVPGDVAPPADTLPQPNPPDAFPSDVASPDSPAEPEFEHAPDDEPIASEPKPAEQTPIDVTTLDPAELEKDVPPPPIPLPQVVNADDLVTYAKEREKTRLATMLKFSKRPMKDMPQGELPDAGEMLSPEQRARFISTIFKNDENYCAIFLSSLNKAQTWREAQRYLRELFTMNQLDILSPDVVEFTDAMQARYHNEVRKVE